MTLANMDWTIRRLENERDRAGLLRLLSNWITDVPVEKRYERLYESNPHGKASTWIAVLKGTEEIIGCASFFPRKIWLRDHIVMGGLGGDNFVDPRFRRQGIASELHRATQHGMREDGIRLLYGFPLRANLEAFIKVGACVPGDFRVFSHVLDSRPILEKLRFPEPMIPLLSKFADPMVHLLEKGKRGGPETASTSRISYFDKRFDRFLEEITTSFAVCCIRDRAYLNWRHFVSPLNTSLVFSCEDKGVLKGYAAFQISRGACDLLDFLVENQEQLIQAFIREIINFARANSLHIITATLNPIGRYVESFKRCGFSSRLGASFPFMVFSNDNEEDKQSFCNLENWYLAIADSD